MSETTFVYSGDAVPIGGTVGQVLTKVGAPNYYTAWRSLAPDFSSITGKPTTVSGYGITDAPTFSGNNAFTGANTFTNSTGQIFRRAATQDGLLFRGRAGGTTSLTVEIVPTTLTASRTLTAPDVSGTLITTGDTGTITSTMIADLTIVDGDISASAAITHSKLASITAGSVLMGNATNVPTATALTGDVTISSSGVTAIGASKVTNAMLVNSTISGVALGSSLNTLTLGTGLTGTSYNGSAAVTAAVSYGTTAGTACQGNDSRLSDTRNTTNALTFNNGGAGAASGSTFNGSAAVTVSYNTIGAAPLDSPAFTGTPTAPTATAGTSTTQLATTAFVTDGTYDDGTY